MGSIPGWGRSPGGGNGNPIQYSCLENPINRGACWLQSMGLQSQTQLRDWVRVRAHTHTHTHTYLLFTEASPQCCVSILKTWRLASLRVSHPRKGKPHRTYVTFHDLALNITWYHFHYILYFRHDPLYHFTLKGIRVWYHLLMGRLSENLHHILKPPH